MTLEPVNMSTLASPAAGVQAATVGDAAGKGFGQALLARLAQAKPHASQQEQATQAARQFVSSALVMPLLKQLRNSPFKSQYLHGGQGEDAFGPQLDQILSDRIVQRMSTPQQDGASGAPSQGMGLVDAVYRRIMRQAQGAASQNQIDSRRKVELHG